MVRSNQSTSARARMMREQLVGRGIRSPEVLEAISRVPRELFVPLESQASAYADRALPIDCEQTISQPFMVASMTELLDVQPSHRVLEIGTGSGYQTAILCELAAEVYSVERHQLLADTATARLSDLGYRNVAISVRNGANGWPEHAPFDRILITAAAAELPAPLWEQLTDGGKIVAPIGPSEVQQLQKITKRGGKRHTETHFACRFVPFVTDDKRST